MESAQDYVEGLIAILNDNLDDYLTKYSETEYTLESPYIYAYEKKTFEKIPSITVLATDIEPISYEAESDVISCTLIVSIVLTYDEERLARLCYLYEMAVRECLRHNREYNGINYKWENTDYSMQYNVGSQIYKGIRMTFKAINQEEY